MITDNKGFWVGAFLGAVGSLAYARQKKKHELEDTYAAKAKQLANQVVTAAKQMGDKGHVKDNKLVYGACSLLGAAMGAILSMNKEGKHRKGLRILNGSKIGSSRKRSSHKTNTKSKKH